MQRTLKVLMSLPLLVSCVSTTQNTNNFTDANKLPPTKLFATLPDNCPTPDNFLEYSRDSFLLSCPNFADKNLEGVILKVSSTGKTQTFDKPPVHPETKRSIPLAMAYDSEGSFYFVDNQTNKGRLLKASIKNGRIENLSTIASGFESINGIRIRNDTIYVTQTQLTKVASEHHSSGLYRFNITDRNININNNKSDQNLIYLADTINPKRKFGLDGLTFNDAGDLFISNLGDSEIIKISFENDKDDLSASVFAKLPPGSYPDGLDIDRDGNIYAAGLGQNQVFKITPRGEVVLIAQNGDSTGANGQLDQPVDVFVFGDKLIISNFDLMTVQDMINSQHDRPYTLSYLDLK